MRPIVFLDTETTSLGPDREPWEIAMIRRRPNQAAARGFIEDSISFFVDGIDLSKADPISLEFSRFYERHPDYTGARPYAIGHSDDREVAPFDIYIASRYDAVHIVHEWTRGAFIVGAVPNFDTDMLDRVLRESRLVPAWHYHLRDVEAMAIGYLAGQGPGAAARFDQDWKSDDLSRACGVEPPSDEDRHTALGDADWAMRWYDAIMAGES